MLTENQIIDQVTIQQPEKIVNIRRANIISRDGVEVSREFHRKSYCEWQYDEFVAEVENAAAYIAVVGWVPGVSAPE